MGDEQILVDVTIKAATKLQAATRGRLVRKQNSRAFVWEEECAPHAQARSVNNALYRSKRVPVDDEHVAWDVAWPDYAPSDFTAPVVLENARDLSTGNQWADPADGLALREELEGRRTFENGGRVPFGDNGLPRNPRGRTGMLGRGLLGQWGPNHAADPIVTRTEPLSGQLQVLAIKRKDTGQWALPGGMVRPGPLLWASNPQFAGH